MQLVLFFDLTLSSSLHLRCSLSLLILRQKHCHMVSISWWFLLLLFSSEKMITKQNLPLRWQTHIRYAWKWPLSTNISLTTKMTGTDCYHLWEMMLSLSLVFHLALVSAFALIKYSVCKRILSSSVTKKRVCVYVCVFCRCFFSPFSHILIMISTSFNL